ncbi:MAG: CapA family protein [Symbiobacterium sp.]|uniref:CapA family protein n=1 Tax=Symbiobacterium sp. TaxID=1971213 RepID=UPI003464DF96
MTRVRPFFRAFLALMLVLLTACSNAAPEGPDTASEPPPGAALPAPGGSEPAGPEPGQPDAPPPEETEPPRTTARILAVGDLLMHLPLVYSSALPDGGWDFRPLFEPVRPWIEGADLAIANLETTLTGPDYPWSGYPSFNTPPEFARDAKAVGFDVLTHANNHSLDYDQFGVRKTNEALDQYGVAHTGSFRSAEEREQILVVEAAPGINVAVLAYTGYTNGIPLPEPWSVNMLDAERLPSDIRRARQMEGVDLVAVALHFGEEYAREPNDEQRYFVDLALSAGADIVLGCHPHVIQPIEVRQVQDEFGRDLPRAVIYSLGNFISNQEGLHREAGLMLLIDVAKEGGVTRIERVSFIPTWVHPYTVDGQKRYRVVAVEQAMRDYESGSDPLITVADYERLQAVWADTTVQAVGSQEVSVWSVDEPVRPVEAQASHPGGP